MNDDYPERNDQTRAHDFDETVRRQPVERPPQPGPMARRVMPKTQLSPRPAGDQGDEPPPEKSGLYVPWWGFALVILVVAGITCGLWGVVLMNRGDTSTTNGPTPTPIFVVITSVPTVGVPPSAAPGALSTAPVGNPTQPPSGGPTATTPAVVGPAITIGATIVVKGTEGSGLTVRQGPGIDYTYIFVANEGEQFKVQDGPKEANGYTWWYIVDPNNADRFGWAVQNYMQVVP